MDDIETRRADVADAVAILSAHVDSIRSIGPRFYPSAVVEAWAAGLTPDAYVNAMNAGDVFFIATGALDWRPAVLGFATHRAEDAQDGASAYVWGAAARRGIGTTLFARPKHMRAQPVLRASMFRHRWPAWPSTGPRASKNSDTARPA